MAEHFTEAFNVHVKDEKNDLEWCQTMGFYLFYSRLRMDGNGDGVGDLKRCVIKIHKVLVYPSFVNGIEVI